MHSVWHDMFSLGLPVTEKVLRTLTVYAFLIVGLRLAGKRELAQLNPFDLVVLLTLSNTVQNAIIGDDNSVVGGLLGAATLLAVNYVVVRFVSRHQRLERVVEGDPDILIDRGVVQEERLRREFLTRAELETAAHRQGFASLKDVERAVLEPGGTITFVGKKPGPEEQMQAELLVKLDTISRQLAEIGRRLDQVPPGEGQPG